MALPTVFNDTSSTQRNFVRSLVRGAYALQQLRIQAGNRIVTNYKVKLGIEPGKAEKDTKIAAEILDELRKNYALITDGIADEIAAGEVLEDEDEDEDEEEDDTESPQTKTRIGRLPTPKKFKEQGLITNYTELILVNQYFVMCSAEEREFSRLKKLLEMIPIYKNFLKKIRGMGPAMGGVIVSEIDIHLSEYPSSIHAYAGLDTTIIGYYVDKKGEEQTVRGDEVAKFYEDGDLDKVMTVNGFEVKYRSVGRSRKGPCLVKREYVSKDGKLNVRDSITFNPFLKTKLVGVLAGSFLKQSSTFVDGKKMGVGKRTALAKQLGWKMDSKSELTSTKQVDAFLSRQGYELEFVMGEWAEYYYNYKHRISNMPEHAEKTELHRHNMAVRFMIKRFLVELYKVWRAMEGLPVAEEYSVAKLGMAHGKAKGRPDAQGLQKLVKRA